MFETGEKSNLAKKHLAGFFSRLTGSPHLPPTATVLPNFLGSQDSAMNGWGLNNKSGSKKYRFMLIEGQSRSPRNNMNNSSYANWYIRKKDRQWFLKRNTKLYLSVFINLLQITTTLLPYFRLNKSWLLKWRVIWKKMI